MCKQKIAGLEGEISLLKSVEVIAVSDADQEVVALRQAKAELIDKLTFENKKNARLEAELKAGRQENISSTE